MKKQIFILVMVLFSLGITKSYGQLLPHTINCLPQDALHPVAGIDYTYQIDVPVATPTDFTSKNYVWYVTQLDLNTATLDKYFIDPITHALRAPSDDGTGAGKFIFSTTGGYTNIPATPATVNTNVLKITWKNITYDAKKPLFVVINAIGSNGTTCDTKNMKVFKIEPIIAFTLDIDNLTNLGASHTLPATATATADYGDMFTQCISPIASAYFDEASLQMAYDYGKDSLFYEVVAANWSTEWDLAVQLKGIALNETVTVEWSKDKTFGTPTDIHAMATATPYVDATTVLQYTSVDRVLPKVAANPSIGAAGESIFIRVRLDHSVTAKSSYEGLADEVISLAVDGMTNWDATLAIPAFTIGDVSWNNTGTAPACAALAPDAYTNDIALQTIKARPAITNATATMPAPGLVPTLVPNP